MPIQVTHLTEQDIRGAIECIQIAFAEDPHNKWIFDGREAFSIKRNSVSLGYRCRWGMQYALFHVAKDTDDHSGKVLGVACWLAPSDPFASQTWRDYVGSWWLWSSRSR